MRPVIKGASPIKGDFADYKDAQRYLVSRIGLYCSYCERHIVTQMAVEHIQPKDPGMYPHLIGSWENYLLGCVNCNSTKSKKNVILSEFLLPDRDNTFFAYEYTQDGAVRPVGGLSRNVEKMAKKTLALVGLDRKSFEIKDENDKLVALDRVAQRMEVWLEAEGAKQDLASSPCDAVRNCIANMARANGFFSIWMKVFEGDVVMRQRFIEAFPGTAKDCFDAATNAISTRPASHNLSDGSKI